MSDSAKKKARAQTTRSSRLYDPGEASDAVTDHRLYFLDAIRRTPEAHSRFVALRNPEALALAARDFQTYKLKEPSAELERRIEGWAVGINLAKPPVRDWWIFDVAVDWLKKLIGGPPDISAGERVDSDECEWDSYCSFYISVPSFQQIGYEFTEFNPSWETGPDYRTQTLHAFEAFLDNHIRQQHARYKAVGYVPAPGRRDTDQYLALVKHQMLGYEFSELAKRASNIDSLRVKVTKLRTLINLPPTRRVGRPPTKL